MLTCRNLSNRWSWWTKGRGIPEWF